ncbi:MAG: hypothetical protein SNH13_00370 [Rikenellaceae bacterium]
MAKKIAKIEKLVTTQEMNTLFEELYSALVEQNMNPEDMLEKLEDIENMKFTEYNTWIPLRGLIMLKSYLLDGDIEAQYICKKRVGAVVSSGTDDQIEAFDMMLEGEIQGLDLLVMAKESDDKEWERKLYIKIIAQLVTICEMGASRKFGYPIALKALDKYLAEARRYW